MKTLWPTARNLTSILSSAVDEQSGDSPLTGKVPFFGKLAFVDLTRETVVLRDIPADHFRTYLGGPGLVLGELLRLIPVGADPLGPENVLAFSPGLLAGAQVPGFPRFTVLALSPLTGALGKSEAAGYFAPELKKAGIAAILVQGRAESPVYLWVTGQGIEIRPATHIWGADPKVAQGIIRAEVGEPRARTASIGIGGENLVSFAGIGNDLSHFNGRNGLGAVMGSKNLKAIAARGAGDLDVADADRMRELYRTASDLAKTNPLTRTLHELGTPAGMELSNAAGCLPTNNWQSAVFADVDKIGARRLTDEFLVKPGGCYMCPIRCKRLVKVDDPLFAVDTEFGGPEYETLAALGSNCGVNSLEVIIKANELCNIYTIDTISVGMTISFAMACYEAGLLTAEDTAGLELRFGNNDAILPLIEDIARRRGPLGRLLADGSAVAARRIGNGAEQFLLTVKDQEIPMHDPRVKTGLGLQFALSPMGGDHWFAQHDPFFATETSAGTVAFASIGLDEAVSPLDLGPDKVRMVARSSFLHGLYDDLGVCIFAAVARSMTPLDVIVGMVNAATGWQASLPELLRAGERTNTLYRLFNHRHGVRADRDTLPSRFFKPFADGPLAGKQALDPLEFAQAVRLYYAMAGWDPETGVPTHDTLHGLGLEGFVDLL